MEQSPFAAWQIFLYLGGTLFLASRIAADAYERGREAGHEEAREETRRMTLFALRHVTDQAEAREVSSGAWRVARLLLGDKFRK